MSNQRDLMGSFSFFDSERGFSDTMYSQAIKGKVICWILLNVEDNFRNFSGLDFRQ